MLICLNVVLRWQYYPSYVPSAAQECHPTPPCPLPSTVHLPPSCKILNSFPVTHRSPSRRSPHQLTNCLTRPMLPKLLLIQWTTWYIVAHFCIKATAGTSQSCVFSWNSIRRGCWAPWAMGLTQKVLRPWDAHCRTWELKQSNHR